ncbi:hypothetical protein [Streptomyces doebereineriae]|uniref:Transposase n=1 Tax=Streptomyces doebereineriae TaxID=3075528 RepID=A0ABU2V1H9_9ACTN|nr:hypothetical protein [Streptomyces sp. DSM 41640]MDT0479381.1 hypothetical protein [Streptomyces sp. DSM 41640]
MARGDLTDEQWAALELLSPTGKKAGRPPRWTRRSSRSDRIWTSQEQLLDIHRGIKLAFRYEATVLVAAINEWL